MYQINLSSPRLFYQVTTLGLTKRAPIVQQQRYGSYNRSQANLAALARAAKFPCNKCGNKFDSKADLDKHESSEHDEGRCSKIILLLLACFVEGVMNARTILLGLPPTMCATTPCTS